MKLIIEIPNEMYECVQNGTYCGTLYEELKNGTPLDESEDCISRQAVLEKTIYAPIARVVTEDKVIYRKIVFADEIENIPPVTPAEKVGQWEYNPLDMCFQCSQCKCCCEDDYKEPPKYKYCPQCGAKMLEVTG